MQPIPGPTHNAQPGRQRLRLFGFAGLLLLAGIGLGAAGGPPRLPSVWPRLDQVGVVLSGSSLPVEVLVLVLLDLAWLMWLWIVGSLALELLVITAEAVAHGAAWVRSLRKLADRMTLPLVRRAVAAAFAVQILSRGVALAAAEPLPPPAVALVASVHAQTAARPSMSSIEAPASAATYVVRGGDTLWSIADQAYGTGTAYRRLVEANLGRRMPDGQVFTAQGIIRPGWELVVPTPSMLVDEIDGQRWYAVTDGDTLSGIAAMLLGDDSRWRELFDLNRDGASPDGRHSLTDPNVIWPGLRLRLPVSVTEPVETDGPEAPPEAVAAELVAASTSLTKAPPPPVVATPDESAPDSVPEALDQQPPLLRTPHEFEPVTLAPSDSVAVVPDDGAAPAEANSTLPTQPAPGELPTLPFALGGVGLAALAGVTLGARRLRRLRPLPQEPESEVVVEGGFAEAQLAHEFTRGLHGMGVDPLAAIVGQLHQLLEEYNLANCGVIAARHGRSATTLTLAAGLSEQPLLVDLAPVLAARLEAEAEAWVSADQDVLLRLVRLRRTRVLPAADAPMVETPWLLPLGVLYDRQTYWTAWHSLGNILVASLPGHGADSILTSLVATLTARRSPEQLRMWLVAQPRALPAPVFDVPHLVQAVDPGDDLAVAQLVDALRAEIDARSVHRPQADLVVVVPELTSLGEQAASFALLAAHGEADKAGVRIIAGTSCPQASLLSPLLSHFESRMVLRMQDEETSVALLGVADAAFLGGGGRLLVRLDGREPVELYGYQVAPDHLERLVRVMRSAYPSTHEAPREPPATTAPPRGEAAGEPVEPSLAQANVADVADVATSRPEGGPTPPLTSVGPPIEVICFGGPRVLCAGQQVWPRLPGGEVKPWELLLYLACQPAEGVSSDEAVEALWPEDEEPDNAPHRFRQLRYRLRRALANVPGAPETDGMCLDRGTLRLDPGVVHSDAQEFLALVRSARINPGQNAVGLYERARELYMGDLLEGPDARRYAWVDERDDSGVTLREHFRRLFQQASTKLAELYAVSGESAASIEVYRELTELDPGDERLWRALFRLHAERGDRPSLLREEHRMREALRDLATDLDESSTPEMEDPSRETVQEYQRLLTSLRDPDRQPAAV
jgi:DNA-binding SARP family transcriptional activator